MAAISSVASRHALSTEAGADLQYIELWLDGRTGTEAVDRLCALRNLVTLRLQEMVEAQITGPLPGRMIDGHAILDADGDPQVHEFHLPHRSILPAGGGCTPGAGRPPRSRRFGALRSLWRGLRAGVARIDDSWVGDLIGGISLFVGGYLLLVFAWALS